MNPCDLITTDIKEGRWEHDVCDSVNGRHGIACNLWDRQLVPKMVVISF